MSLKSISLKTALMITVAILSWSSSFVFIRVVLQQYSPGSLALFRYLIVSATMLIFYLRLKNRHKPTLKEMMQLFFIGFFGIGLYMIAINYGELTVSASITSFIIGMNPIVSMLWAMCFFGEKIGKKGWIGVAVSVAGLMIIAGAKLYDATFGIGMAYIIFAVVCAGMYNVAQKTLLTKFHPIEVAAITAWCGSLVILIFIHPMLHEIPLASWDATASIIYLGVVPGAIGYLAWSYALSGELPPTKVALTLYTLPLFCTFMGWLFLGELPTMLAILGGCVAVVGALIATQY